MEDNQTAEEEKNNKKLPGNYRTTRLSESKQVGDWKLTGTHRVGTTTGYVGLKTPDGREVEILGTNSGDDKDVDAVARHRWEDSRWLPDDEVRKIFTFKLDGVLYGAILTSWTCGLDWELGYTIQYVGPVRRKKCDFYWGYEPDCEPIPSEPNREDSEW